MFWGILCWLLSLFASTRATDCLERHLQNDLVLFSGLLSSPLLLHALLRMQLVFALAELPIVISLVLELLVRKCTCPCNIHKPQIKSYFCTRCCFVVLRECTYYGHSKKINITLKLMLITLCQYNCGFCQSNQPTIYQYICSST